MIKAVLIDLDGTLIDNSDSLYQVYYKFLEHYGHKGTEQEFKTLIGPSIDEIVEILKNKYELTESVQDLSLMYVSTLMLQGFKGTKLFPGVMDFLQAAKNKKVKLALVTSGTRNVVRSCLEPLKIDSFFDEIITSEDVHKAKPHPEIYAFALEKLNVTAEEAVAIEDSEAGVKSATSAKIPVLWINHKKTSLDSDKDNSQDNVRKVANWQEIAKALNLNAT